MIPENYKDIINKLIQKTEDKKAIWGKTSREDEYKLVVGKGAVTTDHWFDEGRQQTLFDFRIWNENGNAIDSVDASADEYSDYNLLNRLHTSAKRAFYKIDETIKDLSDILNSDGVIGTKSEEIDDLPF